MGGNIFIEGIDASAVYHQHIYQILLMSPANRDWNTPVSEQDVRATCVARGVRGHEGHTDALAQWLKSPEAAWAFLYFGETVRCTYIQGIAAFFGDSGCCV